MVKDLDEGRRREKDMVVQAKVPLHPLEEEEEEDEEVPQQFTQEPLHQSAMVIHQIYTTIGTIGTCAASVDTLCPASTLARHAQRMCLHIFSKLLPLICRIICI